MLDERGDLQLVEPVGYLGTGQGTIEVVLGHSPSYHQLSADRENFDQELLVLVTAWRTGRPVRVTLRGTTILAVEPD